MQLTDLTRLELAEKLASREVTSVEATRACLARIAQVDGKVKAFLRLDEHGALAAAEASDKRREDGNPLGPLDGVPVAVKDIFLTEGVETTCASRILQGFVPPYDATPVRLLKEAGMPILGKLNQDEFAMGSSNESSAWGPCHNPWDVTRTPGGSSGGSAAALAAREVFRHAGHGHGRLHPPAGGAHQHGGPQAHLRARVALRRHRLRLLAGRAGSHGAHGGGRGRAAAGAGEA